MPVAERLTISGPEFYQKIQVIRHQQTYENNFEAYMIFFEKQL